MSTVFFTKQTALKRLKIDGRYNLAIFIDDAGVRQKAKIQDAIKYLAKLDDQNPEDQIILAYLKQHRTQVMLINAPLGHAVAEDRSKINCNRPGDGYRFARCGLNSTGEEISVLALTAELDPLKASTEEEAFDIIDAVAHTQEGVELLKGLYQAERLGEKLGKEITPLQQEVLAYIAAF